MTSTQGHLHHYAPEQELTAFEHGEGQHNDIVILINGLNGSLGLGYSTGLAKALQEVGWSMVEVLLSSSGAGWGGCSVKQDAEELAMCVRYFKEKRGKDKVVLMGHSTGEWSRSNIFGARIDCEVAVRRSHVLRDLTRRD